MNLSIDPTEIDRLVDGELDTEARRDLLARLDSSPDGWRRCAVAFLEGQEFRLMAKGGIAKRGQVPFRGETAPDPVSLPERTPATRRANPRPLAMAAAVAGLAFLAGFAARGWTAGHGEEPPRLLVEAPRREAPEPAEVAPAPLPSPAIDAAPPAMPEYVQAQWARAGYDVKPSRRVISVEEGGRKQTFPVDSYRFEFVGRPTY